MQIRVLSLFFCHLRIARDVITVIKREEAEGGQEKRKQTTAAENVLLVKGEFNIVVIAKNAVVAENAESRGDRRDR